MSADVREISWFSGLRAESEAVDTCIERGRTRRLHGGTKVKVNFTFVFGVSVLVNLYVCSLVYAKFV